MDSSSLERVVESNSCGMPMLINRLPFLANRLVIPFAIRGDFAEVNTDSVYSCAHTGNATSWEPESFYPYLEELSKKDFGIEDAVSEKEELASVEIEGPNGAAEIQKEELANATLL